MQKLLCLFLAFLLLFSLLACDASGGADETTAGTPESTGESTSGETPWTDTTSEASDDTAAVTYTPDHRFLPKDYRANNNGMLLRAEFPKSSHRIGETIEGTLMLQNNTGEEQQFYLFVYVDIGDEVAHPEHDPALELSFSETRETVTSEEPLLVTLAPNGTVTLDAFVMTEESNFLPDCSFAFRIELRDGTDRQNSTLLYTYAIPINRNGIMEHR